MHFFQLIGQSQARALLFLSSIFLLCESVRFEGEGTDKKGVLMTILGFQTRVHYFNHLLQTGILCASVMLISCARSASSDITMEETVKPTAEVIGGEKVPPTSPIASKVLYMAYGVQLEKSANSTKIAWAGHCTASAISTRVILTAAHCVDGKEVSGIYISLTKKPESDPLNLKEWFAAKKVRVHENYGGQSGHYENDLALILLDRELPATCVMKLASANQIKLPQSFTISGFGITSDRSDPNAEAEPSSELRFVTKSLQTLQVDAKTFAINQNDHKGFCNGDSGGPGLVTDPQTKEPLILGVVSNTSMLTMDDQKLDPQGIYSLCIGNGNYTNTANPELRSWIDGARASLEMTSP
jgi:hypothetical protein